MRNVRVSIVTTNCTGTNLSVGASHPALCLSALCDCISLGDWLVRFLGVLGSLPGLVHQPALVVLGGVRHLCRRGLGPLGQRHKLLQRDLLCLGFAKEDIVGVDQGGLAVEDSVEILPVLGSDLCWTFG